ncbi:MAG: histidine phosphatase family protein [Magnetovibrio sp.]|nr:histidine phosphatase family protein [Magnetovibrio sp.]
MTNSTAHQSLPELTLLRHGETQWNRVGRYQGQQDSPLTLTGIGQIRAIAQTLRPQITELKAYQVWSSPLTRTRQSVSVFCEELGISYDDVHFDDRLMERAFGRWEGLTLDEIAAKFPDDVAAEKANRWNFAIPGGGESFADVAKRLNSWLDDVAGQGPLIVMAHGGSGRVLRGVCMGASPQSIFAFNEPQSTAFVISNGSSTTINATAKHLQAVGLDNAGLGVRI